MKRVHVLIFGRVQGVFFRTETKDYATFLDLTGWVRNLQDGSVEAVFEGGGNNVKRMIEWCKKGPSLAYVEKVKIIEEPYTGEFEDLRIRY